MITLSEDCIGIHHPLLLVQQLECHWDEAEEGVDKRGVHVEDVFLHLQEDCMQNLYGGMFVVVGAGSKIGHFIDIVRKWVHVMQICCADRVMGVQERAHCHVKQVHRLGDGRLVRLCPFADELE